MTALTQPGTPALLRALNDRTALALLLEHGILTRNRLGELSGLSKPTASLMVQRLEAAGLIEPMGEISAGRGPNAVGYGVRAARVIGVALDVAARVIRATVVDATGTEHAVYSHDVITGDAATDVSAAVAGACSAAGADRSTVQIVAIGLQGSIDPTTDELFFADTLAGWPTTGIRQTLEAAVGCTVLIDNDVKFAAVAERHEGAVRDCGGFALLWMGEGLGLAIDMNGTVYRGAAGGAGEIGYLPVPREATHIDAEAEDLQDLIGGETIAALARSLGSDGATDDEVIASIGQNAAVLEQLAVRIALGVVPVLAILDPEIVVLGGPVGAAGGQPLAELVRARVSRTSHWNPRVIATTVSQQPVLRGTREVLMHEVRERLFSELGALP
ncbi:MAG: ROK family transcriptional regulator [Microbacteriaceae bacterium]